MKLISYFFFLVSLIALPLLTTAQETQTQQTGTESNLFSQAECVEDIGNEIKILCPENKTKLIGRFALRLGAEYYNVDISSLISTAKVSDIIPFVGGEAGLKYGKLSFDVFYQKTDKGQDDYFEEGKTVGTTVSKALYYKDNTLRREDYGPSLGYTVFETEQHFLKAFGGYKWSKTKLNLRAGDNNFSIAEEEHLFKTKGPFIGAAYGFNLFEKAQLGISVSFARLDTNYDILYSTYASNQKYSSTFLLDDKLNAIRYGIFLNSTLANLGLLGNMKYRLGIDMSQYSINAPIYTGEIKLSDMTFDEKVIAFTATLEWEW